MIITSIHLIPKYLIFHPLVFQLDIRWSCDP